MSIVLTVCLPLFKSGEIAWLAMEGLIRQSGITFEWELIIMEEVELKPVYGRDAIESYRQKLAKIGCRHILYMPVGKSLGLNQKWVRTALSASKTSKVMVLQDHDCFSFPERLAMSYNYIMQRGYDWVETNQGIYYDILSDRYALWTMPKGEHKTGLNIALNINLVKRIIAPLKARMKTGLNYWLLLEMLKVVVGWRPFKKTYFETLAWKKGLDTNGWNRAMHPEKRGKSIRECQGVFREYGGSIQIPIEIMGRLIQLAATRKEIT